VDGYKTPIAWISDTQQMQTPDMKRSYIASGNRCEAEKSSSRLVNLSVDVERDNSTWERSALTQA
jgi:hypothetical protein